MKGGQGMEDRLLTPEEVAERLAIKPKTVRDYLRAGKLPSVKIGKLWRVRESDLQEIMKKGI